MNNKKIGFIGAGTMGSAIIKGLLSSNFTPPENIFASEISENAANKISQELGITVFTNNIELVKNADIIVICTKPHIVKPVLAEIKDILNEDKIIISIAAGVKTETIEELISKKLPVIRVMPNTPALMQEGMTAVCKGKFAGDEQIKFALDMFSKVGRSLEVDEKLINAVTGISGSGPAFMYLIIEALADGGVKLGLSKEKSIELAAQTAIGAAKMVLNTGKHPSLLKDAVTTPGGCTIAGLAVMEEEGIRSALIKTVEETSKKASELG